MKIIAVIVGTLVVGYTLVASGIMSALLLLLVAGIVPGTDYTLSPVVMMISSGALLTVLFSYLAFFSVRHEDIELAAPKVARRKKRTAQSVTPQSTGEAILTNQTV